MPRKTLALISGLVIVTVILFVVALRAGQQSQAPSVPAEPSQGAMQPEPTTPAHSVLTVGPNPLNVAPGTQGKAEVTIDTSDNEVTAVQLELGYDPNILSNVKVTTGPAFTNSVPLIDKNDAQAGRYTYAVGITPSATPLTGTGVVATITFTVKAGATGATQLGLLPNSLITARGVANSVMKSGTGTVVNVQAAGGAASPATRTAPVGQ